MTAVDTADAPPCPPWCTETHDPTIGGWEADSVSAGSFYKRCRAWLPVIDELGPWVVSVDRYADVSLERAKRTNAQVIRDVQPAVVYLGDDELTVDKAEALAAQLLEAARLARAASVTHG